jgi:hypothetical protein
MRRAARVVLGALGVALMGYGGYVLLTSRRIPDPWGPVQWLVAVVVVHDALLAPLVVLIGLLTRVRGVWRAGLVVAGCLTAVALPVLIRPGRPRNPSVVPLDYPRNWLIAVGCVAVLTGVAAAVRRWRGRG